MILDFICEPENIRTKPESMCIRVDDRTRGIRSESAMILGDYTLRDQRRIPTGMKEDSIVTKYSRRRSYMYSELSMIITINDMQKYLE